jgi:hypothetical protein
MTNTPDVHQLPDYVHGPASSCELNTLEVAVTESVILVKPTIRVCNDSNQLDPRYRGPRFN